MLPTNAIGWVGRVAIAIFLAAPLVAADAPLFPVPLHFVRRYEDPIANSTTEVDEYLTGNKIITIRGAKTAIADYERHELIEIDRAASTYSVASFDDIAKAHALADRPSTTPTRGVQSNASRETWTITPLGMRATKTGRNADSFEVATSSVKLEVSVDREITLTRSALDAVTGSGYPNNPNDQEDALARACARSDVRAEGATAGTYGLPLDQSITIDTGSKSSLVIRNSIVKITNELPSPELLAIPAGAALVESRAVRMVKTLREAEQGKQIAKP